MTQACGVVAQCAGEDFHIYAVLAGQSGEKMPHVVESDVFCIEHGEEAAAVCGMV